MITNPADRKKIQGVLQEASNSLTRIEAERDLIKEMVKDVSKEYDLPKRVVNKLIKVYHKQSFQEECVTHDEFETLYETVVPKTA